GTYEHRLTLPQDDPLTDLGHQLHLPVQDQEHDRPVPGQVGGDRTGADLVQRELGGTGTKLSTTVDVLRTGVRDGQHGKVHHVEQFGGVNVFTGQTGTEHVVGAGHDFDGGAPQVGVQVSGRQGEVLPRPQGDPVDEQCSTSTDVIGVASRHETNRLRVWAPCV